MDRPESTYQEQRREAERLENWGLTLSIAAALLFVLITAQAAGFAIGLPLIG